MADIHTAEDFNKKRAELEQDLEERRDDLPPANILVAGITGTGKSTLLNAIFGKNFAETGTGRPVTEHRSEYHSEDIPIRIWETVGLELDSEKTRKSIGDICAKIAEMAEHPDPYDKVHAIWYCINSNSKRYQGAELEFIKKLHSLGVPFIIVMTQCSGDEDEVNALILAEDRTHKALLSGQKIEGDSVGSVEEINQKSDKYKNVDPIKDADVYVDAIKGLAQKNDIVYRFLFSNQSI